MNYLPMSILLFTFLLLFTVGCTNVEKKDEPMEPRPVATADKSKGENDQYFPNLWNVVIGFF